MITQLFVSFLLFGAGAAFFGWSWFVASLRHPENPPSVLRLISSSRFILSIWFFIQILVFLFIQDKLVCILIVFIDILCSLAYYIFLIYDNISINRTLLQNYSDKDHQKNLIQSKLDRYMYINIWIIIVFGIFPCVILYSIVTKSPLPYVGSVYLVALSLPITAAVLGGIAWMLLSHMRKEREQKM